MTKVKLCGLMREEDIKAANAIKPDYVGFVFAPKSKRYVSPEEAKRLKQALSPEIKAVGVFVKENPKQVAALLNDGVIDMAQLHGGEDEAYIKELRSLTEKPLIQAFVVSSAEDMQNVQECTADYVLLDSGAGTGVTFDWSILKKVTTPYFLAGGLSADNVGDAVDRLHPYAVDVSSGIETNGRKDKEKMAAFTAAARKENRL